MKARVSGPGPSKFERDRTRESHPAVSAAPDASEPKPLALNYCPNCSQRLTDRGCKLRCERCGYFMDCSDFY